MPDLTLLQGAITSLKVASDIAQGLVGLKVSAEVNAKAIELQHVVMTAQASALAAQSQQFTMLEQIRELEEEIARVKAWERTKQRYELKEPAPRIFVYALKEKGEPPEPAHWICAKCYEDGKRSIIQQKSHTSFGTAYICFECKNEFSIDTGNPNSNGPSWGRRGGPNSWMA